MDFLCVDKRFSLYIFYQIRCQSNKYIYICSIRNVITMTKIIIIILMHTIGDYFLQGSQLRKFKALKIPRLIEHVGIYTCFLILVSPLILELTFIQGLAFSLLNGILHLGIDYVTGKFKVKYFKTNESKYLAAIGIDHTLHLIILIESYIYLYPEAMNTFSPYFK